MSEKYQPNSTTDPLCQAPRGHSWSGWHLLAKRVPLTWYQWCLFCGTRVRWTKSLEDANWPDKPALPPAPKRPELDQ